MRTSALTRAAAIAASAVICVVTALTAAPAAGAATASPNWVSTWAASGVDMGNAGFTGTVRNIVYSAVAGNTVRVRLTNVFGSNDNTFADASIGVSNPGGDIIGTLVPLTFRGSRVAVVPRGQTLTSDAVALTVPAGSDLSVSVYVPHADGEQTGHVGAQQTNYVSVGTDNVLDRTTAAFAPLGSWYYIDNVQVTTQPRVRGTVVAFGDSITDGAESTPNANTRWPNLLAQRFVDRPGSTLSVVDEGIGGNQVLADGTGQSALNRFQRDALGTPSVKVVIMLEGINDIGLADVTPAQLEAGYLQLIDKAHAAGVRVVGATLLPFQGAGYWSREKEVTRQAVNKWILKSGAFDAVINYAAVMSDPTIPTMLNPAYDSGDHLHPNDTGYQAMANAVNLTKLLHQAGA